MRYRTFAAAALVVVLVACGAGHEVAVDAGSPSTLPAAPTITVPPAADPPNLRDVSPEPITQPHFKPVPEPAPVPAPKPIRLTPPTPPPPRTSPGLPVAEPAAPRVLPALEVQPGSVIPPDSRVTAAIADLAAHLEVDPSSLEVLDARQVTWRDGSIGCPTPGLAYSQALVPGYLVVLRSGDASYRYQAADARMPFLCDTPQAPLEGSA